MDLADLSKVAFNHWIEVRNKALVAGSCEVVHFVAKLFTL